MRGSIIFRRKTVRNIDYELEKRVVEAATSGISDTRVKRSKASIDKI